MGQYNWPKENEKQQLKKDSESMRGTADCSSGIYVFDIICIRLFERI